ncbi:unnamed protein product, partial [Closterium sp. NIES-53]
MVQRGGGVCMKTGGRVVEAGDPTTRSPAMPCHALLGDFAKCMRKKGRGMSIFVSVLEGGYSLFSPLCSLPSAPLPSLFLSIAPLSTLVLEGSRSSRVLLAYIGDNQCEVAAVIVAARLTYCFLPSLLPSFLLSSLPSFSPPSLPSLLPPFLLSSLPSFSPPSLPYSPAAP